MVKWMKATFQGGEELPLPAFGISVVPLWYTLSPNPKCLPNRDMLLGLRLNEVIPFHPVLVLWIAVYLICY